MEPHTLAMNSTEHTLWVTAIIVGTPREAPPAQPEPARPASGTRRSRLLATVGFDPDL